MTGHRKLIRRQKNGVYLEMCVKNCETSDHFLSTLFFSFYISLPVGVNDQTDKPDLPRVIQWSRYDRRFDVDYKVGYDAEQTLSGRWCDMRGTNVLCRFSLCTWCSPCKRLANMEFANTVEKNVNKVKCIKMVLYSQWL